MEDKKHLANIGRQILKARKEAGMNQAELAEKAGTHASRISRLEKGLVGVDYEVLGKISRVLGISLDILIGENEAKKYAIQVDYPANPGWTELAMDKKAIEALGITQDELEILHRMSSALPRKAKKENVLQLLFALRVIG